jgi:hypothetical protein
MIFNGNYGHFLCVVRKIDQTALAVYSYLAVVGMEYGKKRMLL